jgi:hypothetical protein
LNSDKLVAQADFVEYKEQDLQELDQQHNLVGRHREGLIGQHQMIHLEASPFDFFKVLRE